MRYYRRTISVTIVQEVEGHNYPYLSERESEILALAPFMTNKEIAKELDISGSTVSEHITHLLDKMSAKTKAEAVLVALASGMARVKIENVQKIDLTELSDVC